MNFIAIDFETASNQRDSACAIGLVQVIDGCIVDEVYTLIRPKNPYFDPFCEKVHGISWEDVKGAPLFNDIWPDLVHYFENNLVVAHNASFDISVLKSTLKANGLPYPSMTYNCTVAVAKKTWPEFYNFKLNTIAAELDMTFNHHHALEDAKVAAQIILKAAEIHDTFENTAFFEKIKLFNGILSPQLSLTPGMNKKKQLTKRRQKMSLKR
ncbi:3'-5' exonuclease [Salipaludibacillus sp. LMS25]|jgi:DNA polymerase-3 subunit epsilon|uniref:3'-5' exonuclease n=1 Tax=Salipaludibacillus sp. LMS25 TaxID=2924031 RepID=UPI0020D1B0E0|nr:3'-5' exonuclease [Salipaludibacillus sp. LMS25]UTR14740.1 3'-5' exonuclease [Salipaludibacillus sp. LMS25]